MNNPTIFTSIINLIWVVFFAYWLLSGIGVKRNIRKGGWQRQGSRLLVIIVTLIIVSSVPGIRKIGFQNNPIWGVLGIIVCLIGFGIAVWARRHLGRNWGMPMTLKENHELVTSGPYQYVRHPVYSGVLLAMLGSALGGGFPWLVTSVVLGIYFVYSAKTEERIMEEQFPDQYPEYKKRTKTLIPFVW